MDIQDIFSGNKLSPVSSYPEIIENVIEFNKVYDTTTSIAFKRYSSFYHWYYIPELDLFAPSKFIGYKRTLINGYEGDGDGGTTQENLNPFFNKIEKGSELYKTLFEKLKGLAEGINKTISERTETDGGLYTRKEALQSPTLSYYRRELLEKDTNYYILDSKGEGQDIDFEQYHWDASRFNKVKEGDLFIYRRPSKNSVTKKFFLFGSGKIGEIQGKDSLIAKILKPLSFTENITSIDLEDFRWEWKKRNNTWEHFFNQYGMNQIPKIDFIKLLMLSSYDSSNFNDFDTEASIVTDNKIDKKDYSSEDKERITRTRMHQNEFAKDVKAAYKYACAICGIENKEFLIGSHIIPHAHVKDFRRDPSNGICLCVFHDRAFDRGFIYIDNEYRVHLSNVVYRDKILYDKLKNVENKKISVPKTYPPKVEYLEYHKVKIFKG